MYSNEEKVYKCDKIRVITLDHKITFFYLQFYNWQHSFIYEIISHFL